MSNNIEFHSQEWWVNRVTFWESMISDNTIIVNEIEQVAQKNWSDKQRNDIRLSREAVRHAQGNIVVAENKLQK
jgi:hypothetical protein